MNGIKKPIDFPRHRKTKEEIAILNHHFQKTKVWERELKEDLAIQLNMTTSQVYKWWFDKTNYKPKRNPTKPKK